MYGLKNSGVATPGLGHVIPAGSLPWSSLLRFLALDSEVRNLHLAPIGELPHNFDCIVAAFCTKCYAIYVCKRMTGVNFSLGSFRHIGSAKDGPLSSQQTPDLTLK